MTTKTKNLSKLKLWTSLAIGLVLATATCLILLLPRSTAIAYATTNLHPTLASNVYVGHAGAIDPSSNWHNSNLQVTDRPVISVILHGASGSAADFSNNGQAYQHWSARYNSIVDCTYGIRLQFAYDSSSLMENLRRESGGNVYWARMYNSTSFHLMKLEQLEPDINTPYPVYDHHEMPKITQISMGDISNHMIILFEATWAAARGRHTVKYAEFRTMLNRIVVDFAYLTGGVFPKINLIAHSRGGLTSLDYAMDFYRLIYSINTIGTPFFGYNFW